MHYSHYCKNTYVCPIRKFVLAPKMHCVNFPIYEPQKASSLYARGYFSATNCNRHATCQFSSFRTAQLIFECKAHMPKSISTGAEQLRTHTRICSVYEQKAYIATQSNFHLNVFTLPVWKIGKIRCIKFDLMMIVAQTQSSDYLLKGMAKCWIVILV